MWVITSVGRWVNLDHMTFLERDEGADQGTDRWRVGLIAVRSEGFTRSPINSRQEHQRSSFILYYGFGSTEAEAREQVDRAEERIAAMLRAREPILDLRSLGDRATP